MTRGKLEIRSPHSEGRLLQLFLRQTEIQLLISQLVMLLVCNIMIAEENSKKFAAEISLVV